MMACLCNHRGSSMRIHMHMYVYIMSEIMNESNSVLALAHVKVQVGCGRPRTIARTAL